ncbi:MAG: superoxide dismutase [Bacteroides sp.]|nr:superoxide dismutase [Bacteroides sp.]
MMFQIPNLPYEHNALEPVISKQTVDLHYGKHLQTYVDKLNDLVKGTDLEGKPIEEVVKEAPEGPIFNNAGQVLNHTLYFLQFKSKQENNRPTGKILQAIERDFGSFEEFQQSFSQASVDIFGSGWSWLSVDKDGKLIITKEANGSNPVRHGLKPLLGFDVWEHAYYLDYQNRRKDHIDQLWSIIDWETVESRM